MLYIFFNSLLKETYTIANRDDGIAIVAILVAEVGAVEHIGYTVAVEKEVAVIVTTHDALRIMLSQHIGDLVPVVHIAIAQRIVGEDKDRRIACGRNAI